MGLDLAWFASMTGFSLCSMYGVKNAPDSESFGCDHIWSASDKQLMQNFLNNAKDRVENFLGYPLTPKFICGERHSWNCKGIIGPLRWAYLQKIGTKAEDTIATINLDYAGDPDPMSFTTAVTFIDTCEARVFHITAKGGEEIFPSSKAISGGVLTVEIPRCKLVDPTLAVPEDGLDYDTDSNFVTQVIVKRMYAEAGTGATLIWNPTTGTCNTCTPCAEETQMACPTIRDKRGSEVFVRPATYGDGVWTGALFSKCNSRPDLVEMDYVAYYDEDCDADCEEIPETIKLAIIHIALADLPHVPCGCNIHEATFAEDSQFPKWIPESNPFGIKLGHVIAYGLLKFLGIGSGGLLVGS